MKFSLHQGVFAFALSFFSARETLIKRPGRGTRIAIQPDSHHEPKSAAKRHRRDGPPQQAVVATKHVAAVPHFAALADFTSSMSLEEWLLSSEPDEYGKHQDSCDLKRSFVAWSSQEQARFIDELGSHGEAEAIVIFLHRYAKRNSFVYNAALSALADLQDYEGIKRVHADMEGRYQLRPTAYTLATLLRGANNGKDVLQWRNQWLNTEKKKSRRWGWDIPWTPQVYVAAIQACARDKASGWKYLNEVCIWMQEAQMRPTTSIYMALFEACAQCLDAASTQTITRLYEECLQAADGPAPRAVILDDRLWGLILQAHAAVHDDQGALRVLFDMNQRNFTPNARHCTTFVKTLSLANQAVVAVEFLNHMAGLPCNVNLFDNLQTAPPDPISLVGVLKACAAQDMEELAETVLQNCKDGQYGKHVTPTEQAYNLVLATTKDPARAYAMIREMRLTRRHRTGVVPPSLQTYTRAISVCRRAGDLDTAIRLLNLALDDGFSLDVFVYSAVIWTAASVGNAECARAMFEEMHANNVVPNIVSYNGILTACAAAQRYDEMLNILAVVQQKQLATSTTYNILTRAARRMENMTDRVDFLERVYSLMKPREKRVGLGGTILECLVFAYGTLGRLENARQIFDSLEGPSDATILRAMLFACSNAHPEPAWQEALELLHTSDIVLQSLPPMHVDSVALAYTMLACTKADQWEESLNLLQLYGNKETSVVAFNSLIAACGRCSRPDVAIEVLNEMEHHGVEPDDLSYRNAIIACNQAEHARLKAGESLETPPMFEWWECALSLLRRMKESGLEPDIQTYSSVISACEAAGKWQRALGVLQSMKEQDKNLYCYNAAISACEKGGAWVEAVELYERMKERRGVLRPNSVTVASLMQALDKAGQKELMQDLYEEAVGRGIVKLWRNSRTIAGESIRVMDLHQCSAALAKAAVRSYLDSLLSGRLLVSDNFVIVVGKGLRSRNSGPVLGEAVRALVREEYGIEASVDPTNSGRLCLSRKELKQLVESRGWR